LINDAQLRQQIARVHYTFQLKCHHFSGNKSGMAQITIRIIRWPYTILITAQTKIVAIHKTYKNKQTEKWLIYFTPCTREKTIKITID